MSTRKYSGNERSRFVDRIWYGKSLWFLPLMPLSWLFALATGVRRFFYRAGIFGSVDIGKPVIVVGNITSGGTGKTPVTLWLAARLREFGFHPGIVSRGYGGRVGDLPVEVTADSNSRVVGDEPLLMAKRQICPVVVHPDRVAAGRKLAASGCDVIIADDGLQHYRLKRRFEIAVVDGNRGFGNGHLLPAGPLREPASRLRSVNRVMLQGGNGANADGGALAGTEYSTFDLAASVVRDLQGTRELSLNAFRNKTVHAIAAIGHPQRFFQMLEAQGVKVLPHAFPDHAMLAHADLEFGDGLDVIMTEKDAVKIERPAPLHWWYVLVDLKLRDSASPDWLRALADELDRDTAT